MLRTVCCVCRVVVKLGPQHDMGIMLPKPTHGWRLSLAGHDFAVWEKGFTELPAGTSSTESAGNHVVSPEPMSEKCSSRSKQ